MKCRRFLPAALSAYAQRVPTRRRVATEKWLASGSGWPKSLGAVLLIVEVLHVVATGLRDRSGTRPADQVVAAMVVLQVATRDAPQLATRCRTDRPAARATCQLSLGEIQGALAADMPCARQSVPSTTQTRCSS